MLETGSPVKLWQPERVGGPFFTGSKCEVLADTFDTLGLACGSGLDIA
jgi:hypothetical protein